LKETVIRLKREGLDDVEEWIGWKRQWTGRLQLPTL